MVIDVKKLDEVDFYLMDLKSKFNKIKPNTYYLSYSGGKDSHFLYWFIKVYLKRDDIKIVGCNTYMEHHEILKRILENSDIVLYPILKPFEIKEKYGIPCFSKEQDFYIYYYQNALRKGKKPSKTIQQKIDGTYDKGFSGISKKAREYVKSEKAHKITHLCCYYLKKKPFHDFEKKSGLKPILGIRSTESSLRKQQYKSCFTSNGKFVPIHDLTDELLDKIYLKYDIEIPEVYKHVTRTGCMGCPYGSFKHETEKELNLINDNQRKFVCEYFKESYEILGIDIERK
jgi:3'-phosphoadenosine 5'-phosphosulfate sulfotransferase (PAPS reductase)/FAD synthetase